MRSRRVAEPLDLTPLLRAYRDGLKLAGDPPASLRLAPWLGILNRSLRPAAGCGYFATRTVRRRIDTLERAVAARAAVGEAGDGDAVALDGLRAFRCSLPSAPSRAWIVLGIILAAVVVQGVLRASDTGSAGLRDALNGLPGSPDVRSAGDLVDALISGTLVTYAAIVSALLVISLSFGRPMGGGYRLAQLCLGQPGYASRRRLSSPLS